jgi:hypothetical protein
MACTPSELGSLYLLKDAESRSVSAENVYGEKGRGGMAGLDGPQPEVTRLGQPWGIRPEQRELGPGWKVRPCVAVPAGATVPIMDVEGPGIIQHCWFTYHEKFHRDLILRAYWDDQEQPSIEVPLADFFCQGWGRRVAVRSIPINVNPMGGYNCYLPMPFTRRARITVENRSPELLDMFFYTINFVRVPELPAETALLHAQFRRKNPTDYKVPYTVLDGVQGRGHLAGIYMAWQQNTKRWWGEGEFKFFIDGDGEYPTICGTGVEDYFGGAWGFHDHYSAPYLGYIEGDPHSSTGARHGLYRFHIPDPIHFRRDLRITVQALGWHEDGHLRPLRDDIASVAYWYQTLPTAPFPALPSRRELEVN